MNKAPCVIFDLDGTLADCRRRRRHLQKSPKDWKAWHTETEADPVNQPVAFLFRTMRATTIRLDGVETALAVVICSGRSEEYRGATFRWLLKHDLQPNGLYMRGADDHRPDDVVKDKLLGLILTLYQPLFVVDDRDRVVDMWRAAGLTCLQCAPGDF